MKLSPLQLEGYYVKEMSFSVRPDIENDVVFALTPGLQIQPISMIQAESITVNTNVTAGINTSEHNRYRFELIVESQNDPALKYPYAFRVVMVGFFKFIGEQSPDDARQLVAVNAPGLLYSSAREVLAASTGRGPCPGVQLPSISFADALDEQPPSQEEPTEEVKHPPVKRAVKKPVKKSAKK